MNTHTTIVEPNVVELTDVRFQWPGATQPTLAIPSLTVRQGEHVFIKGPSGCGKSTLLGLLTGIHAPTSGQINILGQGLSDMTSRSKDRFRADHIGYIFQQFNLLPYLSVLDNVLLPCQFSRRRKQLCRHPVETATMLLQRLHLSAELLERPVSELSIGQQQRVAAARALIGDPALIIADEPTSALDHDNRSAFISLLLEQASQAGATLIFVSHDPTLEGLFNRSIDLLQLNQAQGAI